MSPEVTDWHGTAVAKLTKVLGERAGQEAVLSVIRELGIEKITTVTDLRNFAAALSERGGFAAAVGGMLALHAAMYDQEATKR